jgi:hypothetical protein
MKQMRSPATTVDENAVVAAWDFKIRKLAVSNLCNLDGELLLQSLFQHIADVNGPALAER